MADTLFSMTGSAVQRDEGAVLRIAASDLIKSALCPSDKRRDTQRRLRLFGGLYIRRDAKAPANSGPGI